MSLATQRNSVYNGVKQIGNTVESFMKMKHIVSKNDGKRKAGIVTKQCYAQSAPYSFTDKSDVDITSNSFDITSVRKGYLTAELKFDVMI